LVSLLVFLSSHIYQGRFAYTIRNSLLSLFESLRSTQPYLDHMFSLAGSGHR
jgi:hypothetical protein